MIIVSPLGLITNSSHVNTVIEQMNRLPSKQHETDVMPIRPWYLDGQARFYRQTVILGSHTNPEMNAFLNQHCLNYRGKVKLNSMRFVKNGQNV
ncbi:U3 small nucleolar RNA-associated protein [Perilla frutescens var. frutescens]|nr:U3 small nucleolar RNA-associated protein [Perilla frutescens var. frutescens]